MNLLRPLAGTNIVRNSFGISRKIQPVLAANLLKSPQCQPQKVNISSSSVSLEMIQKESKGILNRIFEKFSNSKSKMRASSFLLYENVADGINYPEFFVEFDLPDTMNSWFLVTELHTWILLTRVMNEGSDSGQDGRFLRNNIVEAMWADLQTRAKKLNADNPSASRQQIRIISEQFQAALLIYDEGLMGDDKILANALWRRFFDMECNDYSKLEKLVRYVRETVANLDNMTRDQLLTKPHVTWAKLNG